MVPTDVDPEAFIAHVHHPGRRADAHGLLRMMQEVTGKQPVMWGPSIIGFGTHHYAYPSGREGDVPCVAFSPRAANLVLYGLHTAPGSEPLLERLGAYKSSVACLYVTRLERVDMDVLRELTRIGYEHFSTTSTDSSRR